MKRFLIIFFVLFAVIQADEYKEKLKEIDVQIKEIQKKLSQINKEKKTLLNDIYRVEMMFYKEKIEYNKINLKIRRNQYQINNLNKKKDKIKKEINYSRKKIKKILRILYKLGPDVSIKIFTHIENLEQLFRNYRFFKILIDTNMKEIDKLKKNIEKLVVVENKIKEKNDELIKLRNDRKKKMSVLISIKRDRLSIIKNINKKRDYHLRLLRELKLEAKRLKDLIKGNISGIYISLKNLRKLKKRLIWPIRGKVISKFGKHKSTRFNTYVFNNGIEIKPGKNHYVRAIYDGVVIFSDYFKGYGNLIIVQHSVDFFSLYGHCDKFLKKKGDRVKKGEHIAIAGDTGSLHGLSLYFEIRIGLKPVNPLSWLR